LEALLSQKENSSDNWDAQKDGERRRKQQVIGRRGKSSTPSACILIALNAQ